MLTRNDETGFSGKRWPQYREEIEGFIALLNREGVTSYLEIGCRYGDTFHAVGMGLPEGSRLIAVDLPDVNYGKAIGKYADSADYLRRAAADLNKHGRNATVIIGDSAAPETVAAVAALGHPDAVLIDGCHSLSGVTADWTNYGVMSRIVAFHDIHTRSKREGMRGPRELWQKLAFSGDYRNEMISVDPNRRGIGILYRA